VSERLQVQALRNSERLVGAVDQDGDIHQVRQFADGLFRSPFPYVRVFGGIGGGGYQFLATISPIPPTTADELASRMPAKAAVDLVELIQQDPAAPAMDDDRPVNEYYYLRHSPVLFGRVLSTVSR